MLLGSPNPDTALWFRDVGVNSKGKGMGAKLGL
jgi:hypothetical protein